MPGLVIFDCDGLLVDSEPVSNRVLAAAISEAGVAIDPDEVTRAFAGMKLDRIQSLVEQRLGSSLPGGWIAEFERRRETEFRRGLDPVPGVAAAIERIRAAEIPICVASQARREKTELTLGLTGLASYFEPGALFSSHMVARGKPDPELFLFAAERMGHPPARCIVVEDGMLGVQAARHAGMKALGYAPAGNGAALAAEGATVFGSMAELPGLLS